MNVLISGTTGSYGKVYFVLSYIKGTIYLHKKKSAHAVCTYKGRQREASVKTLQSSLTYNISRHCVL